MRYWWVNQNQTYRHEIDGGYLWSPKRKSNDAINPFYEFMREVAPGDLVFSFADTLVKAIGIAISPCYDCPKPPEFGPAGKVWGNTGWKVDVRWIELRSPLKPSAHMEVLRPLLPDKYAPLQSSGAGLQGVYLTQVPPVMADRLIHLIGDEARHVLSVAQGAVSDVPVLYAPAQAQAEWEEDLVQRVEHDTKISVTEKRQVILARVGQGEFRKRVSKIEHRCRITKVDRPEHLIASHCKPWRDCESSDERLDGENGLLLTPTVDHLFDRGFISFEDTGRVLVSPVAHTDSLRRMGIDTSEPQNVGVFTEGQRRYLDFHRSAVFLEARVTR